MHVVWKEALGIGASDEIYLLYIIIIIIHHDPGRVRVEEVSCLLTVACLCSPESVWQESSFMDEEEIEVGQSQNHKRSERFWGSEAVAKKGKLWQTAGSSYRQSWLRKSQESEPGWWPQQGSVNPESMSGRRAGWSKGEPRQVEGWDGFGDKLNVAWIFCVSIVAGCVGVLQV